MRWLFTVICTIWFCIAASGQNWEALGPANPSLLFSPDGYQEAYTAAYDKNNVLYCAYSNDSINGQLTVKKLVGDTWETVGTAGISTGGIYSPTLAFDTAGVPYVSYTDVGVNNEFFVAKFTGGSWVNIVSPAPNINYTGGVIRFSPQNELYAVYASQFGVAYPMVCKKYTGTGWVAVGSPITIAEIFSLRFLFSPSGIPTVVYRNNTVNEIHCKQFTGTIWNALPNPDSLDNGSLQDFDFDTSDTPYVVYRNWPDEHTIVKKLVGSFWQTLMYDQNIYVGRHALAIEKSGKIYLAHTKTYYGTIGVSQYDGGVWTTQGDDSISQYTIEGKKLFKDTSGSVHIMYNESQNLKIKKLHNNYWTPVAATGYSEGTIDAASITTDSTAHPVVAIIDNKRGKKISVMRWNDSAWVYLGAPAFSYGKVSEVSIDRDSAGKLYVVYKDNMQGIVAKSYDGFNWVDIGTSGVVVSNYSVNYVSPIIKINDNTHHPQIFIKKYYLNEGTVYDFDGNNWNVLGNTFAAPAGTWYHTMAIDSSGKTYIAYRDGNQNGSLAVRQFDGTAWSNISGGANGISDTVIGNSSAIIDRQNNLVIAYCDGKYNGKATVIKYNGTGWDTLGTKGFSNTIYGGIRLAEADNGTLYLLCVTSYWASTPELYKYDSSGWTIVNAGGAIPFAYSSDIVIDGNYLYYSGSSLNFYAVANRLQIAPPNNISGQWIGGAGNGLWSDPANWANGLLPVASANVTLPSGAAVIIDTGLAVCQNLIIDSGASIIFSNNSSMLHVYGTLTNNGTINTNGGTLQVDIP